MSNIAWRWDEFWAAINGAPYETLVAVGQELDGDDFVQWFSRKAHRTQEEILESAPETVKQHFYGLNAIKPITVMSLGIHSRQPIKTIDRRGR
jgi:hypothetical protein